MDYCGLLMMKSHVYVYHSYIFKVDDGITCYMQAWLKCCTIKKFQLQNFVPIPQPSEANNLVSKLDQDGNWHQSILLRMSLKSKLTRFRQRNGWPAFLTTLLNILGCRCNWPSWLSIPRPLSPSYEKSEIMHFLKKFCVCSGVASTSPQLMTNDVQSFPWWTCCENIIIFSRFGSLTCPQWTYTGRCSRRQDQQIRWRRPSSPSWFWWWRWWWWWGK